MQKRVLLLLALASALHSTPLLAVDDIKILPTPVKLDTKRSSGEGNMNVESKNIAYSVKVTSSAFTEITNLTVKYNIFYEVVELGSKGEPDINVSSGSHAIPSLLTNRPVEFETDPIKLDKASLDPGWHFGNGASKRARDRVLGVWFKAFDSTGKQIGEYINPTTLPKKQKWKD